MSDKNAPKPVSLAFERDCVVLPATALVARRPLPPTAKQSAKYRQIAASVRAIGVIEPPTVFSDPNNPTTYIILDGHLRIEALRDAGAKEIECLLATVEEAFTYNKRINRIAALQEHRMIVRAIERGASEERIAEALALDIQAVRRRFRLLNGICNDAIELLKDKPCPMATFEILKRMAPLRQVVVAQIMVDQDNYSIALAKTALIATPEPLLVAKSKRGRPKTALTEQLARMERELTGLQAQIRSVEDTLGPDTLHLTVAKGYLAKLLGNPRVAWWLAQNRPEYLSEFQNIVEITSTSPPVAAAI